MKWSINLRQCCFFSRLHFTAYPSTNNEKANKIPANLNSPMALFTIDSKPKKTQRYGKKRMTAFYNCQLAKSWEFCYRALLFCPDSQNQKLHASIYEYDFGVLFAECGSFQVLFPSSTQWNSRLDVIVYQLIKLECNSDFEVIGVFENVLNSQLWRIMWVVQRLNGSRCNKLVISLMEHV